MTETRQTFAGLAHWEIVFWYVLIVVSTAIFFLGVALLVLKYRRGGSSKPVGGIGDLARRVVRAATIVFTHRWIKRRDRKSTRLNSSH